MKHRTYSTLYSYIDFLFVMMMGILLLFMLAFPLVNPKQQKDGVSLKAEFIITVEWEQNHDVDLWVQDPKGGVVYFRQREVGLVHLDQDNRGQATNTVVLQDGSTIKLENYSEMVTIRGIVPGEYTVNLHLFQSRSPTNVLLDSTTKVNVPVKVTVQKLNPSVQVVYSKVLVLTKQYEEQTATRFTLDASGIVTGVDASFKKLVR